MPQTSLKTTTQQDSRSAVKFDDLIAQVPNEWRDRFRAFVEKGEDPGGELLAYLGEQDALPESSRGTILNMLDQANRRSLEPLRELGAAFKRAEEKLSTTSDQNLHCPIDYDDLIAQVPAEWRVQFRAFVDKGEDPNGEFYAYLHEQSELPEASGGVILKLFDEAFRRSWSRS